MKTFTAEEFNKSPQKVYREADKNGPVMINHGQYHDVVFVLTVRERQPLAETEENEE